MPTFAYNSLMCHISATFSWGETLWIKSTNRWKQSIINNNNINIQYFSLQNKVVTLYYKCSNGYLCWFGCLRQGKGGLTMNTWFKYILRVLNNTLQHLNYVSAWHKDILKFITIFLSCVHCKWPNANICFWLICVP